MAGEVDSKHPNQLINEETDKKILDNIIEEGVSPNHYARWVIEPITFIMKNKIGYAVGNVIKYVLRYDAKNGLEDLKKARRYIDMIIEDEYGKEHV